MTQKNGDLLVLNSTTFTSLIFFVNGKKVNEIKINITLYLI